MSIEGNFNARLGANIKAMRKLRRMRATILAETVGVHRNTMMRWEKGHPVPFWYLMRIADTLDCNFEVLLPAKQFTWGEEPREYPQPLPRTKPVQTERDTPLTKIERAW